MPLCQDFPRQILLPPAQGEVVVEQLDLGSLANVRGLAARLAQRLPDGAPDLLVLNAGVMATPCGTLTSDG